MVRRVARLSLSCFGGNSPKRSLPKKLPERLPKKFILEAIACNPSITRAELDEVVGISPDGVKYHLQKLAKSGRLKRVGSTRRGGVGDRVTRNSEKGTFTDPFQKFVTDLFSPVTGYMIRFPSSMNRCLLVRTSLYSKYIPIIFAVTFCGRGCRAAKSDRSKTVDGAHG